MAYSEPPNRRREMKILKGLAMGAMYIYAFIILMLLGVLGLTYLVASTFN